MTSSGFKIPVISQPDKTVVFGDVGEKQELRRVILRKSRWQACTWNKQQAHVLVCPLQPAGVFGFAPDSQERQSAVRGRRYSHSSW